jgi:PAS domain S-box-containing protein
MRTALSARPIPTRWPALLVAQQNATLAVYVGGVIAAGATLLAALAPRTYPEPGFAVLLLIAATALSLFKLRLPLNKGVSNMSLAYAVDFVALLLGTADLAMVIAAMAVVVQSTTRVRRSQPLHRVAFNVAAVVISVRGAGAVWMALNGSVTDIGVTTTLLPLSATAIAYFVLNTVLVAQAVALSTSGSTGLAWRRDFLWSAPSYFVSAIVALIVAVVIRNEAYLLLPFAILPLYISYRAYDQSVKRLQEERRHAQQLAETAAAAQEALARAVNSEAALAAEKERLALQTARLGATLRTIGDGVVSVNDSGAVLLMNEAAETLTTLPRAETLDRHVHAIFDALGYAPELTAQALRRVLRDGHPVQLRHDAAGASVLRRLVDITGTPTRDTEGNVTGAVWVIRDVSDAARLELERSRAARLESLGVLAGGLAHDFNNILVGVVGNLSLAQAMVRRDEGALGARLAEAEAACVRARGVTNQLLTFAKGGAPVKTTASVRELVVECARFALSGSPVAPRFAIDPELWSADVDVTQIGQVIHNLVLNAMQAMPRGGVVTIGLDNVDVTADPKFSAIPVPPGDYVKLTVQDSGAGISPEHIGRIFDPYFTTKEKGSGLGLAISYSIVRAHGGAITVESQPGEGCRFDVYLPASGCRNVAARPLAVRTKPTRPGRILLMDDDADVVDVTKDMLQMLGYDTETAACGRTAIERFRDAEAAGCGYDAVILDLTVPGGMGGADAVPQIRELRPDVPVVVTSGYADDAVLARFRDYGFDGVLPKPFGLADLTRAIDEAETNARAARLEQADPVASVVR